jgi:hypothetical protein
VEEVEVGRFVEHRPREGHLSFLGNLSYRGEYDDLELLKSQWVFPLTAPKKDVGAVTVDDPAMDGDDTPSPWTWLWCQPLSEIRNYFGEEVRSRRTRTPCTSARTLKERSLRRG